MYSGLARTVHKFQSLIGAPQTDHWNAVLFGGKSSLYYPQEHQLFMAERVVYRGQCSSLGKKAWISDADLLSFNVDSHHRQNINESDGYVHDTLYSIL